MDKIIDYYSRFDEWGRLEREPIEFQVNWHFIEKHLPPSGHILDNGAGPGRYALKLAENGYELTLTDLTPHLVQTAKEKALERQVYNAFRDFHVADARNLQCCLDEQFHAALMLGPMYHLQKKQDRIEAVRELYRVTKPGGTVFISFMPRVQHVISSLTSPERLKPNNTAKALHDFYESGCFDHAEEGRFTHAYYTKIEDIIPFLKKHGFQCIELIASNVASSVNSEEWTYWKENYPEEMDSIVQLLIQQASSSYHLGLSSHLLYIGRKH
ncbi:class I SAM-dependent methyltransferase [Priestia megaterium]|uniref:class I SAM-dependent methyltransferase n=1 Tax=Priestia megaterium TaxID=1404 RepID=UPI00345A61BA